MTKTDKDTIRRALHQYRDDNFERASAAFHHCTPEEMQQLYGQSGRTRQAILDGYRKHVDRVDSAMRAVDAIPEEL